MKKSVGALEMLKSIILVALFVSMALFASAYILGTQGQGLLSGSELPFDKIFSIGHDSDYGAKEFDSKYLSPEMICIRRNSTDPRAMLTGTGYLSDMYEMIIPLLSDVLGDEGLCERLEGEAGRSAWKACAENGDYVYVTYHTQLPYSIIHAYSNLGDESNAYKPSKSNEAYIKEFFIVSENDGCLLVARDEDLNVYRYTFDGASFDMASLDRYMGRGVDFDFMCEGIYDTVPMLDGGVSLKCISVKNLIKDKLGDVSSNGFRELMRLFDFNPDKLSGYNDTESESASVFVETHGTLRMSEALLEYNASADGGISILDFLSYRKSDSWYDLYDKIKATQGFVEMITRISKESFGGDADLGITHLSYRNNALVVEYSYFFENIYVDHGGKGYAIRFEIVDDTFARISVRPISVEANGNRTISFSQRLAMNMENGMLEQSGAVSAKMRLKYSTDAAEPANISAEWDILAK